MAERVEIDGGVVTASYLHNTSGRTWRPEDIGKIRFFVEYVEHDGGRWCLWDGGDYGEAIAMAEATRRSFGITEPVRDVVAGRTE